MLHENQDADFYDGPVTDDEAVAEEEAPAADDDAAAEDVVEETDAEEEAPAAPELDPEFAEWVKTQDPKAVRKTFEKFTNEWERVKGLEKDLAPLQELRQALADDPALVSAIEKFYASDDNGAERTDAKLQHLEKKFQDFQNVVAVEREIETLRSDVQAEGLPDFDDQELLEYAATNRIGNLEAAYKALKTDDIVAARVKASQDEIKANAKAKVETRTKAAPTATGPKTVEDLENMSDADFREYSKRTQ